MKQTVFSNKRNFVHKFQYCVQDILRWCVLLLIAFTCGILVYNNNNNNFPTFLKGT